jgi:hypothetical protein
MRPAAVIAASFVVAIAGCSFVAADILDRAEDNAPPGSSGSSSSSGSSGSPGGEAGADGAPPLLEDCTNGKDDDGNGLADCADPGCARAGFACADALPAGWTFAAAADACPNGSTKSDILVDPSWPPAQCKCSCTPPTCLSDTFVQQLGTTTCDGAINTKSGNAGNCMTDTQGFGNNHVSYTPNAPTDGSCNPTAAVTLPSASGQPGAICTVPATKQGGGCSGSQVCTFGGTTPDASCIVATGAQECPSGFPTKHVAGTQVADNRGCGACPGVGASPVNCTLGCTGTITWYTTGGCGGGTRAFDVNGVCVYTGSVSTVYQSYKYAATPSCAPGTATPTGSASLTDTMTMCCRR